MAVELPPLLDPDVVKAAEKKLAEAKAAVDQKAKATAKLSAQAIALPTSAILTGFNPAAMYAATQKAGELAESATGTVRQVEGDAERLGASVARSFLPDKPLFGDDEEDK